MIVEVQVVIDGSKEAIWATMTDIENASAFITGIDKIEVLEKPPSGLVGLKWRETRTLLGKPATAEKWITDAAGLVFTGVAKKALLQDLNDIRAAVEGQ